MNKKQQKMSQAPGPKVGQGKTQKSFTETLAAHTKKYEQEPFVAVAQQIMSAADIYYYEPVTITKMQVVVHVPGANADVMFAVYPSAFGGLDSKDLHLFLHQQVNKFQKEMMADLAKFKAAKKVKKQYTAKQLEAMTGAQWNAAIQDAMMLADEMHYVTSGEALATDWAHPSTNPAADIQKALQSAKWNAAPESQVEQYLASVFNGVDEKVACPACPGGGKGPLTTVIVHLNDKHKYTREAIADWLETLDIDITEKEHA